MWSGRKIAIAFCIVGVVLIFCLSVVYAVLNLLDYLASWRQRSHESAQEVAIDEFHEDSRRPMREGNDAEMQVIEFVAPDSDETQRVEIVGVPIENRVRPRARLPKGVVVVPHEDEQVYIDFRKLPDIPEAEPPPPTEEELKRIMQEKKRIASPEFYGRSEYIEYHVSARNSPQHVISNSLSNGIGKYAVSGAPPPTSVSSSVSVRSFCEPTAPYPMSLQDFLGHYRHRQQSDIAFHDSFRGSDAPAGGSFNNLQAGLYPAMESTSDDFDDSDSDRLGSVRREIHAATNEDASLQWQRIRKEIEPNGQVSFGENGPHGVESRQHTSALEAGDFHPLCTSVHDENASHITSATHRKNTLSTLDSFGPRCKEEVHQNGSSVKSHTHALNCTRVRNQQEVLNLRNLPKNNRADSPGLLDPARRTSSVCLSARDLHETPN